MKRLPHCAPAGPPNARVWRQPSHLSCPGATWALVAALGRAESARLRGAKALPHGRGHSTQPGATESKGCPLEESALEPIHPASPQRRASKRLIAFNFNSYHSHLLSSFIHNIPYCNIEQFWIRLAAVSSFPLRIDHLYDSVKTSRPCGVGVLRCPLRQELRHSLVVAAQDAAVESPGMPGTTTLGTAAQHFQGIP